MSYYQYIDGVRYARDLMQAAKEATEGQGESRVSYDEIQAIYQSAKDGGRITDTERRTLYYIAKSFNLTDKARRWLLEQLDNQPNDDELQQLISRVLREEMGLKNIQWKISADEVRVQEQLGTNAARLFESALRGAIDAFLYRAYDALSFGAFVGRGNLANHYEEHPEEQKSRFLDKGTLYLVPADHGDQDQFEIPLPTDLEIENQWVFLLDVPAFAPAVFIAYVYREQQRQYSSGYIAERLDEEAMADAVLNGLLGFEGLSMAFNRSEVASQLDITEGQNFWNALFAALNGGIFNGESSMSFRDFIQQEIWQDTNLELDYYMREYINTGTLHLIPQDYQEAGDFPLPENISLWMESEWYFGLEMPAKTNVRFLINVPRGIQDGITGWNDGFILEGEYTFEESLQKVLEEEFGLPDLNLDFSQERYEAQRDQFGPTWRHAPGLLRQALNTIMDDYLTSSSVFYVVSNVHGDEIQAGQFDDVMEYRTAIREKIHEYLKTASIEFLPIELPDNNPIDGEPIEDFWQFFVMLPDLSDHGFWVIIPRWPDDEQLPYIYGGN